MADEFVLKGKVQLDKGDLKSLPDEAARVASATKQRLDAISRAVPSLPPPDRLRPGFRKSAEDLIREQGIGNIGLQRKWEEAAKARENITRRSHAQQLTLQQRLDARLVEIATTREGAITAVEAKRAQRRGTTGPSAGAGFFRGFATEAAAATGISIPFLALSPTFIAASVAAETLVLSLRNAFGAASQLSEGVQALRQRAGGSTIEVARLSAEARTFGVSTEDLTTGVATLRQRLAENDPVFARLGISLTDSSGRTKTAGTIYAEVRDIISSIKDPTLQASIANDVFGDSYRRLLPILQQTPEVLQANAAGIERQAQATVKTVETMENGSRRSRALGESWNAFWAGIGTKAQEGVNKVGDVFDDLGSSIEQIRAGNIAYQAAIDAGASIEEARARRILAINRTIAEQQGKQGVIPADIGAPPTEAITTLQQIAAAAADARQQAISLNSALLSVGRQRLDISFQIRTAELSLGDMIFDQQQALANAAEDRANRLRLQTAALTIALNSFIAAEQSAQIRAREAEKSFFAFRPDNALARQIEEQTYQRNRQQEIDRNARLVDRADRQLDHQREVAEFQRADLDRQEAILGQQLAIFNLTHPDVVATAERALNDLRAATIQQQIAAGGIDVRIGVTVDSRDFSASENAQIRTRILEIISQTGGEAISIIRAQSLRVAVPGRVGGPQP